MIMVEVILMLINEVCKLCRLTKKAVEYYEEQGLVKPQVLENGYRNFSERDIDRLRKIAILRNLDFSVLDIKKVLNDDKKDVALSNIVSKKALEIEMMKSKQELIQRLIQNQDWEYTQKQLEFIEQKQTIAERLLNVFPGYYGRYVSMHFAFYLNEPIMTQEQQEAFDTIIFFLDNSNLEIPQDLQEYLDQTTKCFNMRIVESISDNMHKVVQDPEKYIADNQETLKQYLEYKQSDEYKNSPVYKLQELFAKFNQESGYYDIFIPAMKKLSYSYRQYYESMEEANKVFLEKYQNGVTKN